MNLNNKKLLTSIKCINKEDKNILLILIITKV